LPQTASIFAQRRVLEVPSEHNCQGWLQGYLLTGRHGIFPCYEAFLPIVDGMMNQYAKFLEVVTGDFLAQADFSLTTCLPLKLGDKNTTVIRTRAGFINNLLTKKGHTYRDLFTA